MNTHRLSTLMLILSTCLVISTVVRAVTPPPDGGYANQNTAEGDSALFSLTGGFNNTALGFNALFSDTNGGQNTATGDSALSSNTTGGANTANGSQALTSNTTGTDNTAIGDSAMAANTTGMNNTANGSQALFFNSTGNDNTATGFEALNGTYPETGNNNTASGYQALFTNSTGGDNTASGYQALLLNTTGNSNTADGTSALIHNTTGSGNTAEGGGALASNTIGINNTANGSGALEFNTTGVNNMANGVGALFSNSTGSNNTADGSDALLGNTTGSSNIALGTLAGQNLTTGSNNIDIGNDGVAGESSNIRIGTKGTHKNTVIAGISGVTVPNGVGVIINPQGKLGTVLSSARFKEDIKSMDKTSEAILALKPVTFRYKKDLDPQGIPQFGLVAEQVERVNPDLVARDEQGKAYTVRYEAVNAMLLNEFLKEHRKIEEQARVNQEQKAINGRLESTVAEQQKAIQALTAQIQKVSDRLDQNQSGKTLVANNH